MKPVHAGLLIVGAALAGGLAVEMTEPQPIPVAPAPAPIPFSHVASPAPAVIPTPLNAPPVNTMPAKPSPIPNKVADAPAPVYVEPVQRAPIRKDKPILTARAAPPVVNTMPPFLRPVPYEPPVVQSQAQSQVQSQVQSQAQSQGTPPQPEPQATPKPEPKPSPRQGHAATRDNGSSPFELNPSSERRRRAAATPSTHRSQRNRSSSMDWR